MKTLRAFLLLAAAAVLSCGEDAATGPDAPVDVARLQVVAGAEQRFPAGRRSREAFRVRAVDGSGEPLVGKLVTFSVEGAGGGLLTQPTAITDAAGIAESWILEAVPGPGRVIARAGAAGAELPFVAERAPGEIRFWPSTGAVGLPGVQHPDSVLRVEVLDTEGAPMPGVTVWFSWPGRLSSPNDTTDAHGMASVVIRGSPLSAGSPQAFAFILEFLELTVSAPRPVAAPAGRVVLVAVDGFRGDFLERHTTPTLARLADEGVFTDSARTVTPSLTVPAHLSLLSSVDPETHGVLNDRVRLTPEMTSLAPLFKRARQVGNTAVAFMSRAGPLEGFEEALGCKLAFGLDSLTLVDEGGAAVAVAARPSLMDQATDLVFVHVPDPDVAGHAHGWSSPEYAAAVRTADSVVARVVSDAAAAGDSTLVIVTSDHGGGGAWGDHLHGSSAPADVNIPLILWGSGVVPGSELEGEVTILDVAPTVLWALGSAPPSHYQGRILTEAFH